MDKPDYIPQIDEIAAEAYANTATRSIEGEIIEAWEAFEFAALNLQDASGRPIPEDILHPQVGDSFLKQIRMFVALLYRVRCFDSDEFTNAVDEATADCLQIREKDAHYGGSWHKRGGRGAFHALARKPDRFIEQMKKFHTIAAASKSRDGESILDTIGDLRRYLILVLAWHRAAEKRDSDAEEGFPEPVRREERKIKLTDICVCGHEAGSHRDITGRCIDLDGCECGKFGHLSY